MPAEEIRAITTNTDGSVIVAMTKTTGRPSKRDIKVWAISPSKSHAAKCTFDYPPGLERTNTQLIAFRPKHAELVTGSDEVVNLWEVILNGQGCPVLGKEPQRLQGLARGEIRAISFDNKGDHLLIGNFAGVVTSIELDESKRYVPEKLIDNSTFNITALAGSDIGVTAIGDNNGKLHILYPGNKRAVALAQDVHRSTITSLSMSADGRWLTSSDSSIVALWDLSLESWAAKACELANHRSFTSEDYSRFFGLIAGQLNTCNKPVEAGYSN